MTEELTNNFITNKTYGFIGPELMGKVNELCGKGNPINGGMISIDGVSWYVKIGNLTIKGSAVKKQNDEAGWNFVIEGHDSPTEDEEGVRDVVTLFYRQKPDKSERVNVQITNPEKNKIIYNGSTEPQVTFRPGKLPPKYNQLETDPQEWFRSLVRDELIRLESPLSPLH